jgi:hypothetical protein
MIMLAGCHKATMEHAARELPLPRLKEACAGLQRAAASDVDSCWWCVHYSCVYYSVQQFY